MATTIVTICPKCERFTVRKTNTGPIWYCVHQLPMAPWRKGQEISDERVLVEKIQCKVVTIGDENENS